MIYRAFALLFLLLASPLLAGSEENWQLLGSVEIKEIITGDQWRVEKTFPPALKGAAKDFEIEGFFVPVLAEGEIRQFLLVEDPADCPFCGNGGYGPVLEVHTRRPVPDMPEFTVMTVKGQLEFVEDPETMQLFKLTEARILRSGK